MRRSTLEISRDLKASGLPKAQAEAIAEKIVESVEAQNDQLVTKDFLRAEMSGLETKIVGVETKIANSETRITQRLIALLLPILFTLLIFLSSWIYFLVKKLEPFWR